MRIGEFSRLLGVSQATVRRLERRGKLSSQRDWNGQRRFTEADLEQAREVLFSIRKQNGQTDDRS